MFMEQLTLMKVEVRAEHAQYLIQQMERGSIYLNSSLKMALNHNKSNSLRKMQLKAN